MSREKHELLTLEIGHPSITGFVVLAQVRLFVVALVLLCGIWLSGCRGRTLPALAATLATFAQASTQQSESSSETQGVQRDKKPPATIQNKYRASWAVIVGIDEYEGGETDLPPLKFAVNDARAIRNLLRDEFGYTDDHVRYLTNSIATRTAIRDAFEQWLPKHELQDGDSLFVFFAGHGLIDDATKRGYLAAVDSTGEDLESCIAVSWLKDRLESLPCRHKVVVLDSCYSGSLFKSRGASGSPSENRAVIENNPESVDTSEQGSRGKRISGRDRGDQLDNISYYFQHQAFLGISAGRLTPVADGRQEDQHSVFTREFLKVLRERANSPREDHAFTFRQLAGRVEAEVAYALGSRQIPDWGQLTDGDGDFVFRPQDDQRETPRELAMKSNAGHLVNRLHSSVNLSPDGFKRQIRELRQLDDFRRWVIPELTRKLDPPDAATRATEDERVNQGKQRADALIALFNLQDHPETVVSPETVIRSLQFKENPEALTQFVNRCKDRGVKVDQLLDQLDRMMKPGHSGEAAVAYGLLLALGEFQEQLTVNDSEIVDQLARWYEHDPSSAIHSAIGWLLRHLGEEALTTELDKKISVTEVPNLTDIEKEWFVLNLNPETHEKTASIYLTFVVFQPGEFVIGSPQSEQGRNARNEEQTLVRINDPFAVCDREVTNGQWKKLGGTPVSGDAAMPVIGVKHHEAISFCSALSALISERFQFRLPDEKEWEFACRAGTVTPFGFGSDIGLLKRFAEAGPNEPLQKAGRLWPNVRGLFDMHGNAGEWCGNQFYLYKTGQKGSTYTVRGGGVRMELDTVRSAARISNTNVGDYGFRLLLSTSRSP